MYSIQFDAVRDTFFQLTRTATNISKNALRKAYLRTVSRLRDASEKAKPPAMRMDAFSWENISEILCYTQRMPDLMSFEEHEKKRLRKRRRRKE